MNDHINRLYYMDGLLNFAGALGRGFTPEELPLSAVRTMYLDAADIGGVGAFFQCRSALYFPRRV
jgi:hypothetical protein